MPTSSPDHDVLSIGGCDVLLPDGSISEGAGLWIEDGLIADAPPATDNKVEKIDGEGLLAIPGLINAHSHSPEACLRGIGEGLTLEPWLLMMFASSGAYSEEDHYDCALASAAEMLRAGVTTVVDHLWMTPPSGAAIDGAMRAYRDAGIRATVAPLMGDRDYTEELADSVGIDLGDASIAAQIKLLPAEELIEILSGAFDRWHGTEGGRLRILAGPSGVQWASDELLEGLAETARANDSGIHIHLLETFVQDASCRLRFGASTVSALDALGILGPDCSFPHSVWLDDDEVALIAERSAVVVHNPAANQRLGSGRAPIAALLDAGAIVALGTDGAASSDNHDLWDCAKLAALIHTDGASWVDSEQAFAMATAGGAAVAGGPPLLGRLEVGAPADVVLIERDSLWLSGAQQMVSSLVLSNGGRGIRHVLVGGRPVLRDGELPLIDEQQTIKKLREQTEARREGVTNPSDRTREAMRHMEEVRAAVAGLGAKDGKAMQFLGLDGRL